MTRRTHSAVGIAQSAMEQFKRSRTIHARKDVFYILKEGGFKKIKIVEFSTKGLTPKWKKFLLAKNDLHVMKQILYDTGRRTVARWPHKRR